MESQDPLSNSSFPQADSIYEDTDADDVDSIYQYKASVHVMKTLNVMRENGEFCDLVIELSNTKFQVHQTVIAVWSPVLKNLLQCQTGRQHVHISYDKPEVFKHLLSFVYTGTFQDETPNIPAILLLAATFQIQLLKELCVEHLKSTVTADNVISLYHLAGKYQLPDLKHHCLDILRQHLPEVAQKHELRELSPRQINSFLGCELVSKKLDPEMKLFLIISWLTEDVSGRQQYLVLLLGHIDWSVVAADFLEEISQTENFFTSNPASLYLLLQTLHSSNISLGPYEKQFQSLREQYSYLLSSVVSGSVISGPTKADKFKPVRFTLISHSKEGVVSMNRQGSSKEDEDTEDFNMDVSCNEDDLYYDNVDQSVSKHEHAKSSNITVSSPFTLAGSEIPLQPSLTRDDGLVSDPFPETATSTTCSSNTSSTVEGSMKRKRVRPRRFITDIDTVMGEVVPKSNESRTRKDHKTKSSKQNLEHKRESSSSLTSNEAAGHETGRPARTKKVVQIGTEKQKTYNSDLSETEGKPTGISQKESETAAESEQGEVTVSGAKKQDSPIQGKRKRGRPPKSVKVKTSSQFTQIKDIATQRTRNASNGKSQEQMQTEKKSEAKLQLLTCSYCDFTTCSRSKLMRHHKKVHEGNCLFCCNLCSFVSKWSKEYHDHMKEKHFPAAKLSSTAVRRAKMKLEDPERYAAFLERERERNRQLRARKRSEWLYGKRTKAAIEAREKELANGRERYRKYMERHRPGCLKRRSSIQSCLHKEPKRPRDMTPEELRAHKAEVKRQWRRQNSLKRRDREAKKKPGRRGQNCQDERPQTQAKDVTPAEEPRKQKAAKPSSTAISRLMSSLQQAKDMMPAEEPRKQKAAKPSSTAIRRLMSSLQQAKDMMPAEEPRKQKAAKPSSTAISRPVSSLQQAKDVTPAEEPRKRKAAKLSRTAIRRAKMKLEDPERYCAFLEKEKERNRQYRAKKRWKWLNERRTNAAIAAHEKELAKGRERYRRYVERHGTTKPQRHRIFRNRPGGTKRPKDMTPDERRAHNAALKREWRQMQSEEKKSLIKENNRQYKKAQRDAIRKLRIGAASPPTASAHDGTLIFAVPDAPQEEQKKSLRRQKGKEAKTAKRATRKRLKDGNASLPTAPACVVTVTCAVPNSPPPHSPTCVSSPITQSHNTHPNKSPQTKPALDWNSALTELLTSPLALPHGLTKQEPLVESSFQELTELESSSFLLSITEAPLSPEEECDLPPPPSPCDSVESLPAADFPPPSPVEEGPPFRCDGDQCSFSADKLQLLLSHRKEHGDPRPFVCDICLMAFRSKSNLYAHFKIHSDEKKYECPECHRCFKVKNTLDQHMVTHSDLRPYLCDLCGFSTKFQSHLISHRRTHTGDVYKCNIPNCSYSTPKKSQLRSHMRSHLGIRPHVCSTCGKAFVEKSHLIRHERIHSAERTFICNQCDYSSTRGDKLREHQQKHHSQDTERAKKAKTGKSKKSGAGNSNKKQVTLPSHENSLVEVVLVKNKKKKTAQNQRSEAIMRAVVGSAGGASLDSQFQFQPLLGESVTGSSINEQVGNMARMMENSIDRMVDGRRQELLTKGVKHESERQLSTAEILERMGLSMADVTSGGDPVFSYGSQTDTITSQRNLASDRQTTIVSTSSFPDSKQMVTNQTSYQLQQQNMLPGNIRVPTFSAINTSSQSAALNSQFGHLVQPQVNLVPIATPDPSSVVPLFSDPPIMVPSSRGSSSLPTHNYHYHQQQQPHHMCQNQQQAQQQHQQHAESSSLPRIGDYLL